MKYYGGGVGAGNNFGTVAVLNHSGTPCIWRGAVSVVPLARNRQAMEVHPAMTAVADAILLSAHDYVVNTQPAPSGDQLGEIVIDGNARDDPTSATGSCSAANEVTPAYWGITTLGQKFTVANYDRANTAISPNFFVGVTSCHGHFGVASVGPNS